MKILSKLATTSVLALSFSLSSMTVLAGDRGEHYSNHHRDHRAFSFALIGDTPYGVAPGEDYAPFDRMQQDINADRRLKWVMHAGDIKGGSSACSDAMFFDRLSRYSAFDKPFILTPGDNEWTDCHRVRAGEYQPLERLARLREVFFPVPGETLGKRKLHLQSQAMVAGYEEFPENVMWNKRGVQFAAIHVVGSQNGLLPFDPASSAVRTAADDAEVARRIDAAVNWLNATFDAAEADGAPGVFIMIHANPVLEFKYLLERDADGVVSRNGFTEFLQALEARTAAFGKPVVLAHGDSHWFRVDKPELPSASDQLDKFHGNFTRVETFGSSIVHWVKVNVDPNSTEVFQFEQKLVPENL